MLSQIVALGAIASVASASLFMTAPVAATVCTGGQACPIKWENNADTAPATLAAYGPMNVGVYVGNVAQQTLVVDLGSVDPSKSATLAANIPVTAGPNGDFYFIRFQQVNPTNAAAPLQAFSAKFTLKGMTGQLSAAASAQLAGVTSGAPAPTAAGASTPAASGTTPSGAGSSKPGMATVVSMTGTTPVASGSASPSASASGSTSGASGVSVAKGLSALVVIAGAMSFFA